MLFLIFAVTATMGLLILLFFFLKDSGTEDAGKSSACKSPTGKTIPRWHMPPSDGTIGDLGEFPKHGSLHQYLLHLHVNGEVPVTSFWWGKTHIVSVCSPQAFKELGGLVHRPAMLYKMLEPLIGSASIVYANGEDWQLRQKCLYHTLKGADLKSYFSHFVSIAKVAESEWSSYSPSDKMGLSSAVFPMTIKGIARTCMGELFDDPSEVERLSHAFHSCWKEMERRLTHGEPDEGSERLVTFEANKKVMMDTVMKIICACREEGGDAKENPPFIDSMLLNYVSDETIISDVMSFLAGGFHTSGYMMTWLLWYLATNPYSQQRLFDEVKKEVDGDCGDKLKEYTYRSDTFMRQVQDETLRLTSLAPMSARYSDEDVGVCGYQIPSGTPIIFALGVASKNTIQWTNEERWDPDWFSSSGSHSKRGNEFCPFGIQSKRKCPGYLFSYFEVAIFIAILIQRFKFVPVEGQDVVKVYGLVTEPKEEIYVHLHQRNRLV